MFTITSRSLTPLVRCMLRVAISGPAKGCVQVPLRVSDETNLVHAQPSGSIKARGATQPR